MYLMLTVWTLFKLAATYCDSRGLSSETWQTYHKLLVLPPFRIVQDTCVWSYTDIQKTGHWLTLAFLTIAYVDSDERTDEDDESENALFYFLSLSEK